MIAKSERLTVLSDGEQEALYGLPDFDDAQRLEYLALTETERALANSRPSINTVEQGRLDNSTVSRYALMCYS
jgi:hypothetical protein